MKIQKDITFIYMDRAEYQSYYPIYEEAKKRGYKVKMSDNKFEKCEIGFYCQHVNFPQNSNFSVIMLHDIIQQFGNWPNIWVNEPWDKYDIGILPGKQWVENWLESSDHPYAHPKQGVFEIGWPKADIIRNIDFSDNREKLLQSLGLDPTKRTILYAPSWENDNKQDDFVKAMLKLDVNIIIKQASVSPDLFPDLWRCIEEMNQLHKDIEGVHIIDPNTNILDAIAICDVLVSEESSTMCEATILGKVAVSVTDWLIPDVTPSRFPCSTHPFTVKTKKINLARTIDEVLKKYEDYVKASQEYSENNFSNLGNSSIMIMDMIDEVVNGKSILDKSIKSNKSLRIVGKDEKKKRKILEKKMYLFEKYYYKYPFARYAYDYYKKIRKKNNDEIY